VETVLFGAQVIFFITHPSAELANPSAATAAIAVDLSWLSFPHINAPVFFG
jgi:hypothetical protein